MIGAKLYANTEQKSIDYPDLYANSKIPCNYSISAENLIEAYSKVAAHGKLNIKAYFGDHADNRDLEEDPVVYARTYDFLNSSYVGNWRSSFDLYYNIDVLPACLHLYIPTGIGKRPFAKEPYTFDYLTIRGNRATIRRPTPSNGITLTLQLKCGQATYPSRDYPASETLNMTMTVHGVLRWWQVIPYYLSLEWLR